MISQEIVQLYGNKIRIRVCGILHKDECVLLVNHSHLNADNIFYNFPGGGVESKETLEQALKREFLEEVNLEIEINKLCFINEFITDELHGIEFYFEVKTSQNKPKLGFDSEFNILYDMKWLSWDELNDLPNGHKANFLIKFKSLNELINYYSM